MLSRRAALIAALAGTLACGRTTLSSSPLEGARTADLGAADMPAPTDLGVDRGPPPECTTPADCDDGRFCNGVERCVDGACAPGTRVTCDDGTTCTADSCVEGTGCLNVPDNTRCETGTVCRNSAGCTTVRCAGEAECDDGFFCNGAEVCRGGVCAGGAAPSCAVDGDECRTGACIDPVGCVASVRDEDGDGFPGLACGGGDCDDGDTGVSPASVERCDDGVDNDCNGAADCDDLACAGAPACGGACDAASIFGEGTPLVSGTTAGASNRFSPSCASDSIAGDAVFQWTAPDRGTFVFSTEGSAFPTALSLRSACPGLEVACDAGGASSRLEVEVELREQLFVVVDGAGVGEGRFELTVSRVGSAEVCNNRGDDDGDGRIDCADPGCATDPACCSAAPREECFNGRDDDCDGATDCDDSDCVGESRCCTPLVERCGNGRDDDCDALVDCLDDDCAEAPECCRPLPELCEGGVDEDCDGLVDCADPACADDPACCVPSAEVCANALDDDCNGLRDCADPACAADPLCCFPSSEVCGNSADDDCDGLVDCDDPSCATSPLCP
ncbi:MAG: MopE-related protein [Myxococcota bacterium]